MERASPQSMHRVAWWMPLAIVSKMFRAIPFWIPVSTGAASVPSAFQGALFPFTSDLFEMCALILWSVNIRFALQGLHRRVSAAMHRLKPRVFLRKQWIYQA